MKTIARFAIAALLFAGSHAFALSLNDISILLPLPAAPTFSSLIGPGESGDQGVLIPTHIYKEIPQLIPELEPPEIYEQQLRLVAIRLDPCFTEGEGPQNCRRQIRLVWQPVEVKGGILSTRDSAVHSFYEFDEKTFSEILQAWGKLSSGSAQDALQIHPRLLQEGYGGSYWKYLRAVIFKYCGEKTLVRVTGMNVMNGEKLWIFQGFDVVNGQPRNINVARIQQIAQAVIISNPESGGFTGRIMPPPTQDPEFSRLIEDSITTKKTFSEAQIKKIMTRAYEYENPTKHNPGTLDCASCHLAKNVREWGQVQFSAWDWLHEFKPVTYVSSWNLQNTTPSPLKTNRMRAFGYFVAEPAISQRVVNETAAVMDLIKNSEAAFGRF